MSSVDFEQENSTETQIILARSNFSNVVSVSVSASGISGGDLINF